MEHTIAAPIKEGDKVKSGPEGKFAFPQFRPKDINCPLLVMKTGKFYARPGANEQEKKEVTHLQWLTLFNEKTGFNVEGPSGNTQFANSWVEKM